MNMQGVMNHSWTTGPKPNNVAAQNEMNRRYKQMHNGKSVNDVNESYMKELMGKNRKHIDATRQSGKEETRKLKPFLKEFENNTSIFTTFNPNFILDKLQGEL